jgi:hypothetical protein
MFSLGTANRAAAAARARDIYLHLAANGWETTLAKFKPKSSPSAVRILTVGDFIRASDQPKSVNKKPRYTGILQIPMEGRQCPKHMKTL